MNRNSKISLLVIVLLVAITALAVSNSSKKANGDFIILKSEQIEEESTEDDISILSKFNYKTVLDNLENTYITENYVSKITKKDKIKLDETIGKYRFENKTFIELKNKGIETDIIRIELKGINNILSYINIDVDKNIRTNEESDVINYLLSNIMGWEKLTEFTLQENGITVQHKIDKNTLKLYKEEDQERRVYHVEIEYDNIRDITIQTFELHETYQELVKWTPTLELGDKNSIKTTIEKLNESDVKFKVISLETDNTMFDANITLNFKYTIDTNEYNLKYTIIGKETYLKIDTNEEIKILNKSASIMLDLEGIKNEENNIEDAIKFIEETFECNVDDINTVDGTVEFKSKTNDEEHVIIISGTMEISESTNNKNKIALKINIIDDNNYINKTDN